MQKLWLRELFLYDLYDFDYGPLVNPSVDLSKLKIQDVAQWSKNHQLVPCLEDTLKNIKHIIHPDGADLYIVEGNEIYRQPKPGPFKSNPARWKIYGKHTILAAHVACTQKTFVSENGLNDENFHSGLGLIGPIPRYIFAFPIICPDGYLLGVYQLTRNENRFEKFEIDICTSMAAWMASTYIKRNEREAVIEKDNYINSSICDLRVFLRQASTFTEYLNAILGRLKDKTNVSTIVICKVTGARKCQFEVYEENPRNSYNWKKNPRILKGKEVLNCVKEALLQVKRIVYNKREEIKEKCLIEGEPIDNLCVQPFGTAYNTGGVILLFNRKGGFQESDFDCIWQTGIHIITAVAFSLHQKKVRMGNEMKYNAEQTLIDVLSPCVHERLEVESYPKKPFRFQLMNFKYYPTKEDQEFCLLDYTLTIFGRYGGREFLKMNRFHEFLMSIYKSYRPVPFHNFKHAFLTLHMTFYVLTKNASMFSKTETLGMLIAAVCHSVDHAGYTNSFYQVTNSNLAKLYSAATHHNYSYYITMLLLQKTTIWDTYDIKKLNVLKKDIHNMILACDRTYFGETMIQIKKLTINRPLDPNIEEERALIKRLILMTSDVSIFVKPFRAAFDDIIAMFEELFAEGDLYKEVNKVPPEEMDRNNWASIPKYIVKLLEQGVIPCAHPLEEALASTESIYESFKHTVSIWRTTTLRKVNDKIEFIDLRVGMHRETDEEVKVNNADEEEEQEDNKRRQVKLVTEDEEEDSHLKKEDTEIEVDDVHIEHSMADE